MDWVEEYPDQDNRKWETGDLETTERQRFVTQKALAAPGSGPVSWRNFLLILLLGLAILWVRKRDSLINPQFWAEDGLIFFTEARTEGLRSLVKPSNGSKYLLLRLIACAGNLVPVRYAPHFYNYSALLCTLGVMAFVLRSRTNWRYKSLYALGVVACPHCGEVFLNLSNLHWILGLVLMLPCVCMIWSLLRLQDYSRPLRLPAVLLLVFIGLSARTIWKIGPLKNLHWKEACAGIGGPLPCQVPVNPEPWTIKYVPNP